MEARVLILMETNIQSIVDKIYQEGIERANAEADSIIEKAKEEAQKIRNQAKLEKDSLIANATKESLALKESTLSELHLASEQALAELRRKISEMISDKILNKAFHTSTLDLAFLQKLTLTIVEKWQDGPLTSSWELLLPSSMIQEAEARISSSIQEALPGLEIIFKDEIKNGFIMVQKEDHFSLDFTDEALKEFFRPFLRKVIAKLFN